MVLRESFLKKIIKWVSILGAIICFGFIAWIPFLVVVLAIYQMIIFGGGISSLIEELWAFWSTRHEEWSAMGMWEGFSFVGVGIFLFYFLPQILALFYFDRFSRALKEKSKRIFWKFPGMVSIINFSLFSLIFLAFIFLECRRAYYCGLIEEPVASFLSLWFPLFIPCLSISLILATIIYKFGYKK